MSIEDVALGLNLSEAAACTYSGTYSKKNASGFTAQQPHNRDSASWKKATHIFLDPPTTQANRDAVVAGWVALAQKDPKEEYLQRFYFTLDGIVYDVYDPDGYKWYSGDIKGAIAFSRSALVADKKTNKVMKLFHSWQLKRPARYGGGRFDPGMAKRYRNALRSCLKNDLFREVVVKNVFEVIDAEQMRALVSEITSVNGYVEFNNNYFNGAFNAAITQYQEFLQDPSIVAALKVNDMDYQSITYGAPGTGKSHGVDEVAGKLPKEDVVRTTFHPDSDYSTFVGAYKPKMELVPRVAMDGTTVKKATYDAGIDADAKALLEVEKRISYEFVPQAFAKAYVQAWRRFATPGADGKIAPVMLVIEEINRGDCAKIFGDLFQLLDRRVKDDQQDATKKAGFSEYPVLADSDLADFIRRELTDDEKTAITNAGYGTVVAKEHLELLLPPNMYIWATMNTSDQSLFPMDSAFKRRWDWKYTPIKDEGKNWKIQVGGAEYDWWKFLKKVNAEVLHLTSSEDKQLGYFFVKPTDGVIDAEMFVNKVMFFLWNVVFKDCYTECEYLKNGDEHYTFKDFFKDDGTIDEATVKKVLDELFKDSKTGATA